LEAFRDPRPSTPERERFADRTPRQFYAVKLLIDELDADQGRRLCPECIQPRRPNADDFNRGAEI
jgi:hypothetical protein